MCRGLGMGFLLCVWCLIVVYDEISLGRSPTLTIPLIVCIMYPVCSMKISYHFSSFLKCKNLVWKPFGYKRKFEVQRIEGLMFYHQLRKLNLTHAWE